MKKTSQLKHDKQSKLVTGNQEIDRFYQNDKTTFYFFEREDQVNQREKTKIFPKDDSIDDNNVMSNFLPSQKKFQKNEIFEMKSGNPEFNFSSKSN